MELLTVLKVIQHFAQMLTNQHVMIRTNNKATAAYINPQGGVRSAQLLSIAGQLLCWAHTHLLSNPPLGVDAFAHRPWPNTLLYAFPAVPLIPKVLDRVQEERLYMILIAPQRTSAPWFPCVMTMVISCVRSAVCLCALCFFLFLLTCINECARTRR